LTEKQFKFKHPYFKLEFGVFPTVRGKTTYKKYFEDEIVEVKTPKETFDVFIISKEIRPIHSLSTRFIIIDGSYPTFVPDNIDKYVSLLNTFRRFTPIEKLSTEVTVFWLEKTGF